MQAGGHRFDPGQLHHAGVTRDVAVVEVGREGANQRTAKDGA